MQRRDFLKTMSVVTAITLFPMDSFSFEVDISQVEFDETLYRENEPQIIMIYLNGGPSELGANLTNIDEIDELSVYKHNISQADRTQNNFWESAGGLAMERMLASGDMNLFRTCFRRDNPIRSHGINGSENKRAIFDKDIGKHPAIFATIAKLLSQKGLIDKNTLMPFIELNGESGFFAEGEYLNLDASFKPISLSTSMDNPFISKEISSIDSEESEALNQLANSINEPDEFAIAIEKSVDAGAFVEMIKSKEVPSDAGYSNSTFAKSMRVATTILINNPDTKIITIGALGLGRWDDHSYGRTTYLPRMRDLMSAIEASLNHIKIANRENIAIFAFAEFGRNVNLNSAGGWDHGNNQNLYLFGGKRYFNHVGIVGETIPYGDALANRLYLKPKENSYWFEPYAVGATIYKLFGIKNPEVLTNGYQEIKAGLLRCNDDGGIDESLIATRVSDYALSTDDASSNVTQLHQAISDTPEGKILYIDVGGEYPIDSDIMIDKAIAIVVKKGITFRLKLTQSASQVLFVNSEGVTLSGIEVNGDNQTNIGIYSNYGNLEIRGCSIYNILYSDTSVANPAWGVGVVPQSNSSDTITIKLIDNEIYNIENSLYDDRRGTYGLARGIHLNYQHLDEKSATIEIVQNHIHDIIAEEDDHISIAHDGSASRVDYPHTTLIRDNRLIGFRRRAIKMMIPNVTIEQNYCESATDFDTTLHPPHTGIDIMGTNSTLKGNILIVSKEFNTAIMASQANAIIQDNQIKLYGGSKEQYLCHIAYNAIDYNVKNNTFEMVDSLKESYFYYIKGDTKGKLLDNYHNITTPKEGKIEAFVFQTVWKDTKISNDMIYQGKRYSGDVEYAVHYSGRESENIEMTEIYQGEYIRTIFEGDKESSAITLKKTGWDLEDVI